MPKHSKVNQQKYVSYRRPRRLPPLPTIPSKSVDSYGEGLYEMINYDAIRSSNDDGYSALANVQQNKTFDPSGGDAYLVPTSLQKGIALDPSE